MGDYHLLEHTADMGIEARGESRAELFLQAARGLRQILSEADGEVSEERQVEVKGGDAAELLVRWLNEILFYFETDGFFPVDFRLEEVGEKRLLGAILGEPFAPQRHPIEREIKSVTYHQLQIEKDDGIWHARIYVDL